jgi:hypothetical protein
MNAQTPTSSFLKYESLGHRPSIISRNQTPLESELSPTLIGLKIMKHAHSRGIQIKLATVLFFRK